jgi:hypothetical protein
LPKASQSIGNGRPGIFSSWSIQEILPRFLVGVPPEASISPADRGELSRLSPSDIDVQKTFPVRKGLVGNSRIRLFPTDWSPAFLNPTPKTTGFGGKLTGLGKI